MKAKQPALQVPRCLCFLNYQWDSALLACFFPQCMANPGRRPSTKRGCAGEGKDARQLGGWSGTQSILGWIPAPPLTGAMAWAGSPCFPAPELSALKAGTVSHLGLLSGLRERMCRTEPAPSSCLGTQFIHIKILLLGTQLLAVNLEIILAHLTKAQGHWVLT